MTLGAYVDVLHALYVDFHASALVPQAAVQAGLEALVSDAPVEPYIEEEREGEAAMLALAGAK